MVTMTKIEFADWLKQQQEDRGWTGRELARRAELSSAAISQVMTGRNFPGVEFCIGIAHALQLPPEQVLREAGLLPAITSGDDETEQKLVEHFRYLNPDNRRAVGALTRTLYEQQREYKVGPSETE